MKDFKLDLLNETASHFDYKIPFEGVDSFAQRVILLLNTWKNEFAYNSEKGIDYETIIRDNFSPLSLEPFFLFHLKKQLIDFETLDNFKAEHDKKNAYVFISFIAYSKSGEQVTIEKLSI